MYMESGAGCQADQVILEGIRELNQQCSNLVIVTNEVFSESVPDSPEMKEYKRILGRINCEIAAMADQVTEVIYGIEGFASNNNKISQNTITGNGKDVYGIAAAGSKYNTISENKITANGNGEKLSFTNYDSIKEGNAGIFLTGYSTHNTIIDNEITSKTGFAVNLNTTAKNNIISNNLLSAKEGSGNDGVNNTNGNTVENNYKYIFSGIVFNDITVAYLDETTIKITAKLPFAGGIPGKANFYINGINIKCILCSWKL